MKKAWIEAVKRFFPGDVQSQRKAGTSLRKFWEKDGIFSSELVWADAQSDEMDDCAFWDEYGFEDPELQTMGRKILAQPTAMTSAERNWKEHDDVHCEERNRLKPKKARDLVFVAASLRQFVSTRPRTRGSGAVPPPR